MPAERRSEGLVHKSIALPPEIRTDRQRGMERPSALGPVYAVESVVAWTKLPGPLASPGAWSMRSNQQGYLVPDLNLLDRPARRIEEIILAEAQALAVRRFPGAICLGIINLEQLVGGFSSNVVESGPPKDFQNEVVNLVRGQVREGQAVDVHRVVNPQ